MKKIVSLVICCATALCIYAVPARRTGRTVTQADGTTLTVFAHGDEHFHWLTNGQGEWVALNAQGNYEVIPALTDEQIQARRAHSPRRLPQQTTKATPLNIAPRGLIILVNFQDKAFTTTKAEMDSMINGQNYTRAYSYTYGGERLDITSKGSAREYFYEASNRQYHPQFDVVGPVTVSQRMSYYGANDRNGNDKNPEKMIQEACELAKSEYNVDFTLYDNDNDDYVDFVYVFYAGYGEADGGSSNTIWPHAYSLTAANTTCIIDDKQVDSYACSNEMSSISEVHDGIGTFCHEFSHVLGLPDLYITSEVRTTHKTLGAWDVMDYGPYNNDGNTPPNYSGYERFFMGWATPRVLTADEEVVLHDLASTNEVLLISETDEHNLIGNDPSPSTFYILENRQQTGLDTYLPGHGLMLTKINYSYSKWLYNTVNNTSSSMGVDLIEADGKAPNQSNYNLQNGYWGKATDLFPAGATAYSGLGNHAISNIQETDGIITFTFGSATPTTNVSVVPDAAILAIYNVLGARMNTTSTADLPRGTYILQTTGGSRKIVIP